MVHGTWRVALIYSIGVIAGSLTASVMEPGKLLVGASGGDYALVFAFMANLIINWDTMVDCPCICVGGTMPTTSGKVPWKILRLTFLGMVLIDIVLERDD